MSLSDVVQIYRKSNRPTLTDNSFIAVLPASEETIALIKNIDQDRDKFGIEEITDAHGSDLEVDELTISESDLTIEITLGSNIQHFLSLEQLVSNSSGIKKGELPSDFYLFEEDIYYPIESNDDLLKLKQLCFLISSLLKLAHYHNVKDLTEEHQLVFLSGENTDTPLVIAMTPSANLLTADLTKASILADLIADESSITDTHHSAKITIFSTTLKEFLPKSLSPADSFEYLILNWGIFADLYLNNLNTYSSGFAFHKAKKEVAAAEITFAEQLSNIMSDINGKILSIPVSLTAIVAMVPVTNSIIVDCLIVLGLLMTSTFIVGSIQNQQGRFHIVKQSQYIVFESIQGTAVSFPDDLQVRIDQMKATTTKNIAVTKNWLKLFRTIAWLPCLLGASFLCLKNNVSVNTVGLIIIISAVIIGVLKLFNTLIDNKDIDEN